MRFTISSLHIGAVLLVLSCVGCTNVFFQPSRQSFYEPQEERLKPRSVYFQSLDGTKLHGWYFRQTTSGPTRGIVLHYHGNAENITTHFMSTIWLLKEGYDLFVFDYRGYGNSEGSAYADGIFEDGIAALHWVNSETSARKLPIILYGQSLGGAVAVYALAKGEKHERVKALIVEGSFWSFKTIAVEKLADVWITWPFQWLGYLIVSNEYGPSHYTATLPEVPTMVMHGSHDRHVPIHHGRWIYEALKPPKCWFEVSDASHINAMNVANGKHRQVLRDFLESGACPPQQT